MPSQIQIVLEGDADQKFISDLVEFRLGKKLDKGNFLPTGGYGQNWNKENASLIKLGIAKGFGPVVVFDANGNANTRRSDIAKGLSAEGIKCPIFLFPNDNSPGNLETLLLSITQPAHTSVLACFDSYKTCLKGYYQPDEKVKVYSYAAAIHGYKFAKEKDRKYADQGAWNLASQLLTPLVDFLTKHV